jgi:hypothetical protein
VDSLTKVSINCPQLCYRYIARVVRGVRIGPSPDWLVQRLQTIGIAAVNNVVDVTNYVLMECGQPLHAFDLAKLAGREIIVREALPGEQFPGDQPQALRSAVRHVRHRRCRPRGGIGRRDGRSGHGSRRSDHRSADRVGRIRAAVDPHDRSRARHCTARRPTVSNAVSIR